MFLQGKLGQSSALYFNRLYSSRCFDSFIVKCLCGVKYRLGEHLAVMKSIEHWTAAMTLNSRCLLVVVVIVVPAVVLGSGSSHSHQGHQQQALEVKKNR